MTAENELQGPHSSSFGGLNLSNAASDIKPSDAAIFHNCDISNDGAIVRRKGTTLLANSNISTDQHIRSTNIRTKAGNEYIVSVISGGLTILKMRTDPVSKVVTATNAMAKTLWKQTIEDVNFTTVTAPYDRLLIFTGSHPVVQLSFLERTAEFTVTQVIGGTVRMTAPYTSNDSTLWNDTVAANYFVRDETTNTSYVLNTKYAGFDINITAAFTLGQKVRLTLIQITWQWWAEASYFEGKNFVQQVARYNVTALDQNVKVPVDLITDYPPIQRQFSYSGLYAASTEKGADPSVYVLTSNPVTENEFGPSAGGRYIGGAGKALVPAPFFITFGTTQAAGGVGVVSIFRRRKFNLKKNTGIGATNIDVWVNGRQGKWVTTSSAVNSAPPAQDYLLLMNTTSGGPSVINTGATELANEIDLTFTGDVPAYADQILIVNRENTWLYNAQQYDYRKFPVGINLDGCYVACPGLGSTSDYVAGRFHTNGIVYRDRLFLTTPEGTADQIAVSEVADITVPGEFYTFFQIDENLKGVTTDPFTVNVTANAREGITALIGWQQSVIVFTNEAAYAISGGEVFGPDSYAVTLASSRGAFNQRCVVVTDLTILYMNRYGLFDLLTKPNTSDFGSAERSGKVRALFNNDIVGDGYSSSHWMSYNTSTSKLYIGLAVNNDRFTCSRILCYNVIWDAWTTMSHATNFDLYNACQAFDTTVLVTKLYSPFIGFLATEQEHYLDFLNTNNVFNWGAHCLPPLTLAASSIYGGVVRSPIPFSPMLNDAYGVEIDKVLDTYVPRNGFAQLVEPRNPIGDLPGNASLIGNVTPPERYLPVGALCNGAAQIYYPNTTVNGNTGNLRRYDLVPLAGMPNPTPGVIVAGVVYPSIYASPVFDLESLGLLKRLKRLHLQWDTTVTLTPMVHQSISFPTIKRYNAAFVSVISNYRDQGQVALDSQLVKDELGGNIAAKRSLLTNFTLQGFGCNYQFYVTSVGGESFKLTGYEFEVMPQRSKRYQR